MNRRALFRFRTFVPFVGPVVIDISRVAPRLTPENRIEFRKLLIDPMRNPPPPISDEEYVKICRFMGVPPGEVNEPA